MGEFIACIGTLVLGVILYGGIIYGAAYLDDVVNGRVNKKKDEKEN